jgi:general secretion pathway protein J
MAEARSNLERVAYARDGRDLRRAHYAVLDRAPGSLPISRVSIERAGALRLRYYGCDRVWREAWPPREAPACEAAGERLGALPRAVEFRLSPEGLGEIRRVVELPSSLPPQAGS